MEVDEARLRELIRNGVEDALWRYLGKVEVVGPNPTQGFIYSLNSDSKKNGLALPYKVAVDYASFGKFLSGSIRDRRQIEYRISIAREYGDVLDTADASRLLGIESVHKRLFVMKTLSKLAKFQGRYAEWQKIRAEFGLSWKEEDDVTAFKRMTGSENIDDMLQWVRQACAIAPDYKDVLTYACLTGLRPAEVFLSLGLPNEGYYDTDKGIVEHWRRPDLFIRQRKKAFISIMTDDLLRIRAAYQPNLSYNALRLTMRRHKVLMNMQYCRKIYGTWLKSQGVDGDLIELLQGRLPRSVFLRFYNRPNFKQELDRVRCLLYRFSSDVLALPDKRT